MTQALVSFGAGRSSINRRPSARRTVTATPRRSVAVTTVSAPPGLTTDSLYFFTTSALLLLNEHIVIRLHSRKQPPGAAGLEPKKRMPLPIWQSIMR